jgi:imidazolonepropionase-like amidohydrolase
VLVPGFVDAYCHAGLSGEGTGIPAGKASHRLTEVIRHDDAVLRTLAGAGLTSVFVSGRDAGLVSGRVAAIKTGAADQESMVLKEIAAIRFVYDDITPGGIKGLEGQIDKAKAYIAAWQKYDKELADWKAGKRKPEAETKVEKKPEPKKETDYISGLWKLDTTGLRFPLGFQVQLELQDDDSIKGTVQISFRGQLMGPEAPISRGKYDGKDKSFEFAFAGGIGRGGATESVFKGRVDGDNLNGTVSMGSGRGAMSGEFRGERTAGLPGRTRGGSTSVRASKKPKDGSPQKPDVDDNLEPMKALLQKEIPAIISTTRAPAIREIVASFKKTELPYILQGARDAVETPDILGDSKAGFLFTPDILERKGMNVRNNAVRIAEAGHRVGLVSGDTEGARYLPLHAALAVRYGMDPTEALKAISLYPARLFKLDHRIGSLERGKDADFVVFSGNPLEMTSQVQLVVINGRVVVDNRAKGSDK